MPSNTATLSHARVNAARPGFGFFRVMGPVATPQRRPPPWHIPALLRLLAGAVVAMSLQASSDSVFVKRGRGSCRTAPRPGEKPAVHRDRTPTPPDITPGIIARGHARLTPGVPHTARTPLWVREKSGGLIRHFVVFPPPTREESHHHRRMFGADQRPSPGTALSPPPPPWRDPRPARESPTPPPCDPAPTHTQPTNNNNRHTPAQRVARSDRSVRPGCPLSAQPTWAFPLAEPQPPGCSNNHHQHNITTRPHRARFGSGSWDRLLGGLRICAAAAHRIHRARFGGSGMELATAAHGTRWPQVSTAPLRAVSCSTRLGLLMERASAAHAPSSRRRLRAVEPAAGSTAPREVAIRSARGGGRVLLRPPLHRGSKEH